MRVYLDMCCLQRPLDDKSQPRVALEAEAVLNILAMCETGLLELISSDVLEYENSKNPYPIRKAHAIASLEQAREFVELNDEIENRAAHLVGTGLKPLDALHMSCAQAAEVEVFCTCDDPFLKRARKIPGLPRILSPIELIEEIER